MTINHHLTSLISDYHRVVPINDKSNFRQRSMSTDKEDEDRDTSLEEPLKAKKRRESSLSVSGLSVDQGWSPGPAVANGQTGEELVGS